ncbi:MAG: DUF4870 domain-containing protein [Anaerolineales bacterium]|nr:DUF4870 domain-containing protein [Anaerolineales bacterium]
MASNSVTSDDKLWAALAWLFTPVIPIIVLLLEDKKNRPFIKSNSAQALAWAVAVFILGTVLTVTVVGACLVPFLWLPQLYFAFKAYQGEQVTIPFITDFVKNQGWG